MLSLSVRSSALLYSLSELHLLDHLLVLAERECVLIMLVAEKLRGEKMCFAVLDSQN